MKISLCFYLNIYNFRMWLNIFPNVSLEQLYKWYRGESVIQLL